MTVAIIRTGGKQYKVEEGSELKLEKLSGKEDAKITFEEVLFWSDGKEIKIGNPLVEGIKVTGKILAQGKSKKVFGIKQKAKKRQLKKFGHRQAQTKVVIEKIVA